MSTTEQAGVRSVHRISLKYRWMTVILVPALVALMLWASYESIHNNLGADGEIQLWVILMAALVFGGMTLLFLSAVVWAFRARVIIEGEQMTVRGAFLTTVITPERMSGYRYINDQLNVYLLDRRWGIQIAYFEQHWIISQWIHARTNDIVAGLLAEEDAAISGDQSLGFTDADKEERLEALRRVIRRVNYVVYFTVLVGFINFLYFENADVELIAFGALMLVPLYFDMLALANRGHVRIDYEEGSRYPQILTGTMTAGAVLAMFSLLDRGALLGAEFYELLFVFVLAKGLLWCFIDRDRLQSLLARSKLVTAITVVALFAVPGFWVGGSLYQVNKLLDQSPTSWHETNILEKNVSSGKTTSYSVELAPWDPAQAEPVEFSLRRAEFERLEVGMPVQVGVREGAIGIEWAADLLPATEQADLGAAEPLQ